jgi:predicted RNA methylase
MCAGQGRDLLGVLADHPRRNDVRARLVELDPHNAAHAEEVARSAGLDGVQVVAGDAALSAAYDGLVPVHVALVCGVFGNITDEDIRYTVQQLPRLCQQESTVIWTRHRRAPDVTAPIRAWFTENGLAEVAFDVEEDFLFGVGTNRLTGPALPYRRDVRLFDFVGDGTTAPL